MVLRLNDRGESATGQRRPGTFGEFNSRMERKLQKGRAKHLLLFPQEFLVQPGQIGFTSGKNRCNNQFRHLIR